LRQAEQQAMEAMWAMEDLEAQRASLEVDMMLAMNDDEIAEIESRIAEMNTEIGIQTTLKEEQDAIQAEFEAALEEQEAQKQMAITLASTDSAAALGALESTAKAAFDKAQTDATTLAADAATKAAAATALAEELKYNQNLAETLTKEKDKIKNAEKVKELANRLSTA